MKKQYATDKEAFGIKKKVQRKKKERTRNRMLLENEKKGRTERGIRKKINKGGGRGLRVEAEETGKEKRRKERQE